MPDADEERNFPLKEFLGMTISSTGPGHGTAHVHIGDVHLNPFGAAHGAVVFAMVDTSMGRAATSLLDDDQQCATVDIQLRYLRPVLAGDVVADTHVVHRGRTMLQLESKVTDTDGRLLATGTGAFAITRP